LDGYTREDVLNVFYDYDNSPFLNELTEIGFFVGRCSQSNYASTKLALPAVMNLNYIPEVLGDAKTLPPLESSVVNQTLDNLGYTTIAFENRARGHFDLDEDIHLSRNPVVFENMDFLSGISEFESMVIETSMLRLLIDMKGLLPETFTGKVKDSEYYDHYLQTEFILEELGRLPEMEGPIFVFAHILVPHSPFVFSPTGGYEPSGAKGSVIGYRNNVEYLNSKLPDMLRKIIDNSEVQPIIVIMGDHGPMGITVTPEQRMAILNVYYVNEEAQAFLYEEITPVNSFRVIFNQYFGTDYPLLEDISYYKFKKNQVKEDSNSIEIPCWEGWE
jgi:hypothetical protein